MSIIQDFKYFKNSLDAIGIPLLEEEKDFHIYRINSFNDKSCGISTPSFRQYFFDITLFTNSDFDYSYADKVIAMKPNVLQIAAPRQIQKIECDAAKKNMTDGYTIYFKAEFLSINFDNANFIKDFPFFCYSSCLNILDLSISETKNLKVLMQKMSYEYLHPSAYTNQILNGYLWAFLHMVKRIWVLHQKKNNVFKTSSLLVSSFQSVVADNLYASIKISDYADMLNISPKHLSEIIKIETGVSAKQMINDLLFTECKSLLKHSTLDIAEIAYQLKFSDPSYFSRFFKRQSGQSPSSFREQPLRINVSLE